MTFASSEIGKENRYARAIAASKKARWDIDADVIRRRSFDPAHEFLPDALSLVNKLGFLTAPEQGASRRF